MVPEATFEISLLYQGLWLFDPVYWMVVWTGAEVIRRAVLVQDEDGKIVLPH